MHYYANFVGDRWHSMKKATLYAKGFHTSQVILTFSIYLFHFIAGRKKNSQPAHAICGRPRIVITIAAAFRFCDHFILVLF